MLDDTYCKAPHPSGLFHCIKRITDGIPHLEDHLAIDPIGAKDGVVRRWPHEITEEMIKATVARNGHAVKAAQQGIPASVIALGGYTGDACDQCGNMMMVRNGACLKCTVCGTTTGCS